jgi:hypothetical protein
MGQKAFVPMGLGTKGSFGQQERGRVGVSLSWRGERAIGALLGILMLIWWKSSLFSYAFNTSVNLREFEIGWAFKWSDVSRNHFFPSLFSGADFEID